MNRLLFVFLLLAPVALASEKEFKLCANRLQEMTEHHYSLLSHYDFENCRYLLGRRVCGRGRVRANYPTLSSDVYKWKVFEQAEECMMILEKVEGKQDGD